ncbi:MAG: NAD(P)H-hydrate dehydratase [Candidatus Omnitrophota bacterium]|nr:NAD(P)H-hydrate dehydratase [Candidatus Omnitrophota bacterium]
MLQRKPAAHKGDFGHIFILAGCAKFSGAAVLCAESAMRAGAGLVTLGIPKSINSGVIKIKPKEVMTLPLPQTRQGALSLSGYKQIKDFIKSVDVVVVGPGLSQDKSTQALARKVISGITKPMVIDADGLNALAGHLHFLRTTNDGRRTTVLTPHPGEMARLLGVSVKQVQADREGVARRFAQRHKVVLVLKGHHTVVVDARGKLYINKTGNPGMAKAGSGDVLTGIIAAFLGQGLSAFEAAQYAVYLHGLAGDLAAKEKTQICLLASDIIAKIPEAVKKSS